MPSDDYPGPHIIGRGALGMERWVWVAPEIPQQD
jgi:hypothetical protein